MMCGVRGREAVVGLTSWGYGCGRPNRSVRLLDRPVIV